MDDAKFKLNRQAQKIYSPHTTRKKNLPFEYKLNSKSSDKTYRREQKRSGLGSSKISSWVDVIGNGAHSEINSNMYRNKENPEMNISGYKK